MIVPPYHSGGKIVVDAEVVRPHVVRVRGRNAAGLEEIF